MPTPEELATLRHELQSPLTTIRLYTEALLSESTGPLTAEQRTHLQEIDTANKKMIEQVSRLGKA